MLIRRISPRRIARRANTHRSWVTVGREKLRILRLDDFIDVITPFALYRGEGHHLSQQPQAKELYASDHHQNSKLQEGASADRFTAQP